MPKQDMKLFGCPICGFRVSGTEEACPRCGTKYGPETRFECPFCGDHVPKGAKACPSCHVVFKEFHREAKKNVSEESIDQLLIEIIELEAHQVKQEEKRYSCPRCSWMLTGGEDRCPKCGAGFVDEVSYQCPICAATVAEDAVKCTECGTSFAEEEAPTEAAPAEEERPAAEEELGAPKPIVQETVDEPPSFEPVPEQAVEEKQPEPLPEPEPAPEPEPVREPELVPEPVAEAPATPEPVPEPVQEEPATAEPQPEAAAATQPAQRKLKTRKLKAKPKE